MSKTSILFLFMATVLSVSFLADFDYPIQDADAAAQLPSISACTQPQLSQISTELLVMVSYLNDLTDATETYDLDETLNVAIKMEAHWYLASPDIPYCAQGVHSRLLIDRVVVNYVLAAYALNNLDIDQANFYLDRVTESVNDLSIYADILETYQ